MPVCVCMCMRVGEKMINVIDKKIMWYVRR